MAKTCRKSEPGNGPAVDSFNRQRPQKVREGKNWESADLGNKPVLTAHIAFGAQFILTEHGSSRIAASD
jgi:hypothetical protein